MQRLRAATAAASALAFLHSRRPEPIVHRDVKVTGGQGGGLPWGGQGALLWPRQSVSDSPSVSPSPPFSRQSLNILLDGDDALGAKLADAGIAQLLGAEGVVLHDQSPASSFDR